MTPGPTPRRELLLLELQHWRSGVLSHRGVSRRSPHLGRQCELLPSTPQWLGIHCRRMVCPRPSCVREKGQKAMRKPTCLLLSTKQVCARVGDSVSLISPMYIFTLPYSPSYHIFSFIQLHCQYPYFLFTPSPASSQTKRAIVCVCGCVCVRESGGHIWPRYTEIFMLYWHYYITQFTSCRLTHIKHVA